jgi:hypothetical protein
MGSMTLRVPWGFEVGDVVDVFAVVVTGSDDLAVFLKFL